MSNRTATIERTTKETQIRVTVNLDGTGQANVSTGIGFFDHMLDLLARHSGVDLDVQATGDLHVDQHHTVEDVGICLGQALAQALGDKAGIVRYGDATVPMDETLASAAVDLSGRPFFVCKADLPTEKVGDFDAQLIETFWQAVATHGAMNLHIQVPYGQNTHHIAEAIFKACAKSLQKAVTRPPGSTDVPSTKGTL